MHFLQTIPEHVLLLAMGLFDVVLAFALAGVRARLDASRAPGYRPAPALESASLQS